MKKKLLIIIPIVLLIIVGVVLVLILNKKCYLVKEIDKEQMDLIVVIANDETILNNYELKDNKYILKNNLSKKDKKELESKMLIPVGFYHHIISNNLFEGNEYSLNSYTLNYYLKTINDNDIKTSFNKYKEKREKDVKKDVMSFINSL